MASRALALIARDNRVQNVVIFAVGAAVVIAAEALNASRYLVFIAFAGYGLVTAVNAFGFAAYQTRVRTSVPRGIIDFSDVLTDRFTPRGLVNGIRVCGVFACGLAGVFLAHGMTNGQDLRPADAPAFAAGASLAAAGWWLSIRGTTRGVALLTIEGSIEKSIRTRSLADAWHLDPVNGLSVLRFDLPRNGTFEVWLDHPHDGSFSAAEERSHAQFSFGPYGCNAQSGSITLRDNGRTGEVHGIYSDVNDSSRTGTWSATWELRGHG